MCKNDQILPLIKKHWQQHPIEEHYLIKSLKILFCFFARKKTMKMCKIKKTNKPSKNKDNGGDTQRSRTPTYKAVIADTCPWRTASIKLWNTSENNNDEHNNNDNNNNWKHTIHRYLRWPRWLICAPRPRPCVAPAAWRASTSLATHAHVNNSKTTHII